MQFEYTGMTGEGMTMDLKQVAAPFAERLSERLDAIGLEGPVEHLVFCPVILAANLNPPPDHEPTYSRKRRSLFVARNIQYNEWAAASLSTRLRLLVAAFEDGVHAARPRHLTPRDKNLLVAQIDLAATTE